MNGKCCFSWFFDDFRTVLRLICVPFLSICSGRSTCFDWSSEAETMGSPRCKGNARWNWKEDPKVKDRFLLQASYKPSVLHIRVFSENVCLKLGLSCLNLLNVSVELEGSDDCWIQLAAEGSGTRAESHGWNVPSQRCTGTCHVRNPGQLTGGVGQLYISYIVCLDEMSFQGVKVSTLDCGSGGHNETCFPCVASGALFCNRWDEFEPVCVFLFGGWVVGDNLSSVENPGWLFDIGDEKLPNYIGIIISQYKDPY